MNDEQQIAKGVAEAFRHVWLWVVLLAGGTSDYLIQMQRGLKPRSPIRAFIAAYLIHAFVAVFSGVISAMIAGAFGWSEEMAIGAAAGLGSFMGIRVFDVITVLFAKRTGIELPK